jgi:hypothetical protein
MCAYTVIQTSFESVSLKEGYCSIVCNAFSSVVNINLKD